MSCWLLSNCSYHFFFLTSSHCCQCCDRRPRKGAQGEEGAALGLIIQFAPTYRHDSTVKATSSLLCTHTGLHFNCSSTQLSCIWLPVASGANATKAAGCGLPGCGLPMSGCSPNSKSARKNDFPKYNAVSIPNHQFVSMSKILRPEFQEARKSSNGPATRLLGNLLHNYSTTYGGKAGGSLGLPVEWNSVVPSCPNT